MVPRFAKVLRLALREAVLPLDLDERIPEPTAEMNSLENIRSFHAAGERSLLPVYDFNARAIDALAPQGARVVDLGSGTGQFLGYLARHRPDLRIVGVDLAENMIRVGREELARVGLDGTVNLSLGDMREFRRSITGPIDLVTSVFSLHHLPTRTDLAACLDEVAATLRADGARLWIFDHARPRRRQTADEFPEIFTPDAMPAFRQDSRNSLCASWSYEELHAALHAALAGELNSGKARLLPLYQIHWVGAPRPAHSAAWRDSDDLPGGARSDAQTLARLFRSVPRLTA